jgi:hypothetical protein
MLVLTDADRLRVDLHEFRERILEPARNRHCAAQRHVEAGQLLRSICRRRIYRCTCLRYHDLLQLEVRQALQQLGREFVGLA